ncbi:hypothetical protein KSF73_07215 [Burkholderiaceae bacterium DAT-1]|nr:hypothetical protein [Burkholderiaceae bacterium DAT-1]
MGNIVCGSVFFLSLFYLIWGPILAFFLPMAIGQYAARKVRKSHAFLIALIISTPFNISAAWGATGFGVMTPAIFFVCDINHFVLMPPFIQIIAMTITLSGAFVGIRLNKNKA